MQLHFLLNTRELGIERHNVGAVVYCSENIPFKEIVSQIPEVSECLNGFHTPIPKMFYSIYRVKEWDGKVLTDLPVASVNVSVKNFAKKANHYEGKLIVKNPGQYLAAAIALTLRNAKTDASIRPAYFDDGYFYLMPGESKEIRFQVDCKEGVDKMLLRVDGYNVESKDILLNK